MLVVGSFQETTDRFSLRLRSDKKLVLALSKEMYEKLGIEGTKLDKCGERFIIELDLTSISLQSPEHKFRARLLENASNLFKKQPLCFIFSCSTSASPQLKAVFPQLEQLKCQIKHVNYAKIRTMAIETPLQRIPEMEMIEDFGLWVGSLISGANNLRGVTTDPFIAVCPVPDGGPERNIVHLALKSAIVPTLSLIESMEQLLEAIPTYDYLVLVGKNARGGFSMLIDPLHNFLFISNQ